MKHWRFILMLGAVLLALAAPGRAQGPPAASSSPDVLVLVFQRPGLGDQVSITYNRLVPHAQVQQDLMALRSATGWLLGRVQVSDDRAPVQKGRFLTGAKFIVPNVVQNATHTLPVGAFITAFRSYKNLALIFIADSSFQFQGWRQYADNNVRITLDQHGSAYTYRVAILNSQFDRLNLSAPPVSHQTRRVSPLLLLLGIALAAAATGILVYIITDRLTPKSAERSPKEAKHDSEETLLGPRR